jgi:hypothetical protein
LRDYGPEAWDDNEHDIRRDAEFVVLDPEALAHRCALLRSLHATARARHWAVEEVSLRGMQGASPEAVRAVMADPAALCDVSFNACTSTDPVWAEAGRRYRSNRNTPVQRPDTVTTPLSAADGPDHVSAPPEVSRASEPAAPSGAGRGGTASAVPEEARSLTTKISEYRHSVDKFKVWADLGEKGLQQLWKMPKDRRDEVIARARDINLAMAKESDRDAFLNHYVRFNEVFAGCVGREEEERMRDACAYILRNDAANACDPGLRSDVCREHEAIIDALERGESIDEVIARVYDHHRSTFRRWFPDFDRDVLEHNRRVIESIPSGHTVVVIKTSVDPLEFDPQYGYKSVDLFADAVLRGVQYVFMAPSRGLVARSKWLEGFCTNEDRDREELKEFQRKVAVAIARKKDLAENDKGVQTLVADAFVFLHVDFDRPFDRAGSGQTVGPILDSKGRVVSIGHRHFYQDYQAYPMIESDSAKPQDARHWEDILHETFRCLRDSHDPETSSVAERLSLRFARRADRSGESADNLAEPSWPPLLG